ncbi:MBL fold metallo-hydrolase [Kineococcus sp. SYSU DK001]|uniref:MBL fold metallo-hydrolase n=1 Tax=Kineococcus sp. SYSU DK001 TaxID=3383122 RepID=UPI003D7CF6A5
MSGRAELTEVADGVFLAGTGLVNRYLLRQGRSLTLVDGGYPADAADVLGSLTRLGARPGDVEAVLVTHAHTDHVGGLGALLAAAPGLPVLTHPDEVAHAHRDRLEQVSTGTVLRHAWRPRVAAWAVRALRGGGTRDVALPRARGFTPGAALDLPGAPVPVPTPGHTSGHTAYRVPGAGALLTGDALVTAHPTTTRRGPQLLPRFFHHDPAAAARALAALAGLPEDLLLPGHGPVLRVPAGRAVRLALSPSEP